MILKRHEYEKQDKNARSTHSHHSSVLTGNQTICNSETLPFFTFQTRPSRLRLSPPVTSLPKNTAKLSEKWRRRRRSRARRGRSRSTEASGHGWRRQFYSGSPSSTSPRISTSPPAPKSPLRSPASAAVHTPSLSLASQKPKLSPIF